MYQENFNYSSISEYNLDFLKLYWKYLILIGIFYLTPSLQFILFQSSHTNIECYYNKKCHTQVGNIHAFNNVISNILYIIFGFIYIIIVRLKKKIDSDGITNINNNQKSLYYTLGISLILEGISSSIYHICPSKLNFQFDTTFMILGLFMSIFNTLQ